VAANFPLHTVVSSLMVPAHAAAVALFATHGASVVDSPGYRRALIEMTVILNAAMGAAVLHQTFHDIIGKRLQVSFGIYNLDRRTVGLPDRADPGGEWQVGLFKPPTDQNGIEVLSREMADSRLIRALLEQSPEAGH
jgi:carbonic anhydrase